MTPDLKKGTLTMSSTHPQLANTLGSATREPLRDSRWPQPIPQMSGFPPLLRTVAYTVGLAALALALLGFVASFQAVSTAVRPSFGDLAWTVPLGADLGILVFSALDLLLAGLNMPVPWLRAVPIGLTAGTVWLNVAAGHTLTGKIAHALMPALWVVFVEVARHAVRTRAGLAAGTRMDRIRASRWLLAPRSTLLLWRRMVLWEVTDYRAALQLERDRLIRIADLRARYRPILWRVRAGLDERLPLRLGPADTGPCGTDIRDGHTATPEPPSATSRRDDLTTQNGDERELRLDTTGPASASSESAPPGDTTRCGDTRASAAVQPDANEHAAHVAAARDATAGSPRWGDIARDATGSTTSERSDTGPIGTDVELEALAILADEPDIAGAELGRRLGRTPRTGQRLRSRLANHAAST